MNNKIYGYLMDKQSGGMIGVNFLGFLIASFYQEGKKIGEIVEILCQVYRTVKLEKTIADFIENLEKRGLHQDRLRIIKVEKDFHPLTIQMDLSWRCNLRCRHCYLGDTKLIAEALNEREWKEVIKQSYKMQIPKIAFLGGEPIMAEYFFSLSKFAAELGFKLYTTTNGTLVTPSIANLLLKCGYNEIDVSLDGAVNESHEFLRGIGTFKHTLAGIEYLIASGLRVKSATVLYSKNFREINDLLRIGNEMNLDQMYFNPLLPGGRGKEIWRQYELNFSQWLIVKETIRNWNTEGKKPKAFAESNFDFGKIDSISLNLNGCDYAGCKAGKRELIITPDGFVASCPLVSTERRFQTMNVRNHSLEEIWQNDQWICTLRQIDENTIQGRCKKCQFVSVCKGGCHILALFEKGDLNQPDPRCPHVFNNE